MLFMHIAYISHLSNLLLLLVSDMFIICHGRGFYKEAGGSPASPVSLYRELSGVQ